MDVVFRITLLQLLLRVSHPGGEVRILPERTLVLYAGDYSVIDCYTNSSNITWLINDTRITETSTLHLNILEKAGISHPIYKQLHLRSTLKIIPMATDYNASTVRCAVTFNGRTYTSDPTSLFVQGSLDPVDAVTLNATSLGFNITWSSPFSMDVGYTDPDIMYCVEINTTLCFPTQLILKCELVTANFLYTPDGMHHCRMLTIAIRANNRLGNTTAAVLTLKNSCLPQTVFSRECPSPSPPDSGSVVSFSSSTLLTGTTATINCNPGFYLSPPITTTTCNSNGSWSPDPAATSCNPLPTCITTSSTRLSTGPSTGSLSQSTVFSVLSTGIRSRVVEMSLLMAVVCFIGGSLVGTAIGLLYIYIYHKRLVSKSVHKDAKATSNTMRKKLASSRSSPKQNNMNT